eukprot:CAMPEP_0114486104 /NCGR_PEP_ID=MMETSP0109-20121206/41_1 /TAXON_ID=29199 /ORGANISM="Chlorarachnion reptans, Strain CCCM449" /LENGTH=359 /DNA_ID=CAMNT_0001662253 /DNA_START=206 /DNA_END=1282 /DNA_ORIENTATION=-
MSSSATATEVKRTPYSPIQIEDHKTQVRVLYIRHGESVSNFFKKQSVKAGVTPKGLLDVTKKELHKVRKILEKEDLNRVEEIKLPKDAVTPSYLTEFIGIIESELQDVVLSEKGVRDAKIVRRGLFGQFGEDDQFNIFSGEQAASHIIVSPLRRTQQTFMEVFGEKLHSLKSNISIDVNPYFHEWVKRDTVSSRCHDVEITGRFPILYAKHGGKLFNSSGGFFGCCSGNRNLSGQGDYTSDGWHKNLVTSAKALPKGWNEKGSKLAGEYAYANGAETFTTFYQKQVTKILKTLDESVDEGKGCVLVVAHGMIGKVIFKEFLGDYDMKNFATIEALWDKSQKRFIRTQFLQNDEGSLPAW